MRTRMRMRLTTPALRPERAGVLPEAGDRGCGSGLGRRRCGAGEPEASAGARLLRPTAHPPPPHMCLKLQRLGLSERESEISGTWQGGAWRRGGVQFGHTLIAVPWD